MSTNENPPPAPVEGGVSAVETFLLGKLRAHRPLTRHLESPRSIAEGDGASHVVAYPENDNLRDTEDPPAVVVGVEYVTGSSEHLNLRERKNHNPQIRFECRDGTLSWLSGEWAKRVRDEIVVATTETSEGWYDQRVSGGSGLGWNDSHSRWEFVVSLRLNWRG